PSRRRLSPSRQGRRHSRPGPGIEIPWRPRSSRSFPGEMWILSCSPARRQGEGRIAQTAVSLPIRGFSVTLNTVASIPEELVRMGCIMNRIARLFLIGTMAFVLVVLMPLSAQASQALTRVEHPNVLVTIDPEASSQNEVTIAAFPSDRNVLVATARDTRQASGFSWAGYYGVRGLGRPHPVLGLRGHVRLHIRRVRRPRYSERQTRRSGELPRHRQRVDRRRRHRRVL